MMWIDLILIVLAVYGGMHLLYLFAGWLAQKGYSGY